MVPLREDCTKSCHRPISMYRPHMGLTGYAAPVRASSLPYNNVANLLPTLIIPVVPRYI